MLLAPAAAQAPAFDAASVRPSRSKAAGGDLLYQPGGRFVASYVTVADLIVEAYDVEAFRVVGGPEWIRTDQFDVQARSGADVTMDEVRLRLRTMLADRFKLRVRMESRDVPIYALVAARADRRTGPGLQPASPAACQNAPPAGAAPGTLPTCGRLFTNPNRVGGRSVPLSLLATRLSPIAGRVVVDRTGLTGLYDLDASWGLTEAQVILMAAQMPPGVKPPVFDPNKPSMSTALDEQLGLRLESTTGPADVVIVERVERPTEN
jgi:uncharacterized protein (TIGR03435 family)